MTRSIQFFTIVLIFLSSCFGKKATFENKEKIDLSDTPLSIEYFKHIDNKAFKTEEKPSFTIIENKEILSALKEIKKANNPELMKGAGFDKIKISYKDTIIYLNTNGKRIGLTNSGEFYYLNEPNFIMKYISKD